MRSIVALAGLLLAGTIPRRQGRAYIWAYATVGEFRVRGRNAGSRLGGNSRCRLPGTESTPARSVVGAGLAPDADAPKQAGIALVRRGSDRRP